MLNTEKQQLSKLLSHTVNKNVKFWYMFFHDAVRTQVIGTESKKKVREKGCSFQSFVLLLKNYFWPVKTYSPVEPLLRKKSLTLFKKQNRTKKVPSLLQKQLVANVPPPLLVGFVVQDKGHGLRLFSTLLIKNSI